MFWLYWRRMRFAVLGACVAVASLGGLIVLAGWLAGADARAGAGAQPGAQARPGTGSRARLDRPVVPPADAAGVRRGMRLMSAAAIACRSVSYRGVQMVAWSGPSGSTTYLISVWHRSGAPELAQGDGDVDDQTGSSPPAGAAAGGGAGGSGADVGVLSVLPWMPRLLRAHYLVEYSGTGSANDRPALIVAVRRRDGVLAARYWLDRATGLPLRREMFDSRGRLVNEGAFIDLAIGDSDVGALPPVSTQAWRGWNAQLTDAGLAGLRRQGWAVPRTLAGDMALVGVTRTMTRSGAVLDASYSDGLSVVSVFMQRGQLPRMLPGWHEASVQGSKVYSAQVDGRSLAWSARGVVYTLIADAPSETVQRMVVALPHDGQASLWVRVSRGLGRIGSWFDPFS